MANEEESHRGHYRDKIIIGKEVCIRENLKYKILRGKKKNANVRSPLVAVDMCLAAIVRAASSALPAQQ